jgi:uncharacterized protein with HEPN domain
MAHDYLDIEVDVIADVVADYLPGLRAAVGKALSET